MVIKNNKNASCWGPSVWFPQKRRNDCDKMRFYSSLPSEAAGSLLSRLHFAHLKSSFVRQISQTIWLRLNLLAVPVKAAPKGTALVAPSAYRPVAKRRFRKYFLMGLNFLQSGHQLLCRQISMIRVRNQGFYAFPGAWCKNTHWKSILNKKHQVSHQ
jgi:hypothetical protein